MPGPLRAAQPRASTAGGPCMPTFAVIRAALFPARADLPVPLERRERRPGAAAFKPGEHGRLPLAQQRERRRFALRAGPQARLRGLDGRMWPVVEDPVAQARVSIRRNVNRFTGFSFICFRTVNSLPFHFEFFRLPFDARIAAHCRDAVRAGAPYISSFNVSLPAQSR